MLRTAAVATLLLLASAPAAHAGQCAPRLLTPTVTTPDGAVIPANGGIVVADVSLDDARPSRGQLARPFPGALKDWRFISGKQRVTPTVTTLAPGLRVLAPAGTRLIGDRKVPILSFTVATKPLPTPAAPAATAVLELTSQGRRSFTSLRVKLTAAAPVGRYLVVLDKDGKVPRSWGLSAGGDEVIVYAAGGCTVVPDGTVASRPGEQVRLMWVDTDGRTSPVSAPLTVAFDTQHNTGPLGSTLAAPRP